ncbi:MAG: Hsp20/alpha crystallin family protein [Lachnospiraceae bacterium]|nr:Hsp20/alpha crystallin family protein [Lachnospiraceae bacterium]
MLVPSIFNHNFVDDMFDDFFKPVVPSARPAANATGLMNTDVKEFNDRYELEIDLPGYKKEDVQASLKDGYMTITAQHEESKDEKDDEGKYIRRERYSGHCSRSFYVGDIVTEEDIQAKFSDGILKIEIPKKESKPEIEEKKYISIG